MFLDCTDLANADVLLALDGEIVGYVHRALVRGAHGQGFVDVDDPDHPGTLKMVEGRVDFLGHVGDPPARLQARLAEIRGELGR